MQKIKVLDKQEAIKIAAGEVVERPAHILKELLENSIDAGATQITIYTQQAGKKEITIIDNGSGMSPEDAKLCFAHHATSKISSVQELDQIATYGFRGEALSSICSVSNVELTTKTDQEQAATQIIMEYGKFIAKQEVAHATGTTLKITNLFENVPARKKFLKSHDTEWNNIVSIFQAFCLRYPQIHFKLFHDGKLAYNCLTTESVIQKSAQLWDNALHEHLIHIEKTTEQHITISGAISKAHYHRYNRNQMFIFVNNRWVKNIELYRAIMKGYQGVLPVQKYPAVFLNIELDPKEIDVNVHPKKEEVKFLHPGIIQKIITNKINQTLYEIVSSTINSSKPKQDISQNRKIEQQGQQPFSLFKTSISPLAATVQTSQIEQENVISKKDHNNNTTASIDHILDQAVFSETTIEKKDITQKPDITVAKIYEQEPYKILNQLFATYILIEQNNNLILIDQHAAHERILYESFKTNFDNVASVQLLFPQIISLNKSDIALALEHSALFKQHGITFEQFNEEQLLVQATPVHIQQKAVQDIILSTIQTIKDEDHVSQQELFKKIHESIHTQKACKAAYKAGDNLTNEQMNNIVKTLQTTQNNFCCPHGRPTMWNLSIKEIEKYFKRDYKSNKQQAFNL